MKKIIKLLVLTVAIAGIEHPHYIDAYIIALETGV